jgi:osmotically-inducible protein OsmY
MKIHSAYPEQTDYVTPPSVPEVSPLSDAVHNALAQTGHGWLQRIVVVIEGRSVILRGKVPNFYLKQMAQVTVLAMPNVEVVKNELHVEGGNR